MQGVQRIQADEAESGVFGPVDDCFEIGEVTAAPVTFGTQSVEGYVEAGGTTVVREFRRQIGAVGTDNEVARLGGVTIDCEPLSRPGCSNRQLRL